MRQWMLGIAALGFAVASVPAATNADWYDKAVKSVTAEIVPAEAKPGQVVTLKITVALNDGYYTYPAVQPDKAAAGMVNKLDFPADAGLVFVGETLDPADFKTKAEPDLGINELVYIPGTAIYQRKAVVSPKASAGKLAIKPTLRLNVCDKNNCYPAKTVAPTASLTVLEGSVPVDPKYADEVKKSLGL